MARKSYQAQLDQLREDVAGMADLVLERYEHALVAMETGDDELAEEVIVGDHDVNSLYLHLEGQCIDLLALQQPVASDLRFIAASFKIITDLERVADLATNLARYSMELEGEMHPAVDLRSIADTAGDMVADAISAYEDSDPDACREIARRDDALDTRCEEVGQRIVKELIEDTTQASDEEAERILEGVSTALLTIRDLERVGDHAVNISARTLYMIENDDELIY